MQSYPLVTTNYTALLILQVVRELLKQEVSSETVLTVMNTMIDLMEVNEQEVAKRQKQDRAAQTAIRSWLQPGNLG